MTRKFAIRLLMFAALLLAVNALLDRAFKAFSVHNLVNEMMDRQFLEYDDTLRYLAMGNSHNCINTRILNDCFNYGSPSENYIQTYYKLKHILQETGKKPETLLLQADISSFGPKIASRFEYNSYWIRYIDYFELAAISRNRDMLTKWLEGRFFSYAGNYKDVQLSILYRIKMKDFEMYRGYRLHRDYRNFANEPDRQRVAWSKANLVLSKDSYFDPVNRAYFRMIMELCQAHGVRVLLVRFPMTREFYGEETKIVPEERLFREVRELASQFTVFEGIMDYTALYFDQPEYFFDPDHLNIKGSDLFTLRLAEDLATMSRPAEHPGENLSEH